MQKRPNKGAKARKPNRRPFIRVREDNSFVVLVTQSFIKRFCNDAAGNYGCWVFDEIIIQQKGPCDWQESTNICFAGIKIEDLHILSFIITTDLAPDLVA